MGVLGVALLSTMAAIRAYPVPARDFLQREVGTLKVDASKLKVELVKTTELRRTADAEAKRLQAELHEKNRHIESQTRLLKEAEADNIAVRTEAARETRLVGTRLITMFSAGLSNDFFEARILQQRELVTGKPGAYLAIRLKDGTGSEFVFPKGQYRLSVEPIQRASDQVRLQVTDLITHAGGRFEVFFRGGATPETWTGPVSGGSEFGSVAYRRLESGERYGGLTTPAPFPTQLANEDLPLLRAAFFRSVVVPSLSMGELLHKAPSTVADDRERTVELILYIKRND